MGERRLDRAALVLVVAIVLALALNGLPFWARRVGLIDRAAHERDLALFCRQPPVAWWLPASCRPRRLASIGPPRRYERIEVLRLYRLTPMERAWKAGRQLVPPLLLLGSAALLWSRQVSPPAPAALAPLLPLAVSTLLSAALSWPLDGPLATLAAGASSLWIPQAALAGWLTTARRWRLLADGAAILVLVQLPFAVVEAMRGLPLPFGGAATPWLPTRLSGLMNQPNSLGGLLALAVALCVCVSRRRWQRWPLLLLALVLALLARSGAGVVALIALAAGLVGRPLPRRWRVLGLVGGLVVLTALLPWLLGRPALYASPGGRVALARQWWTAARPMERWLGHGLASQSDPRRAEALRAPGVAQEGKASRERGRGPSGDGQPLLLLAQGGVVAAAVFYGLVGWCAWRDPLLRPFWGVLTLLSLTLNVTEVFPMGIWLAVATARALAPANRRPVLPSGGE